MKMINNTLPENQPCTAPQYSRINTGSNARPVPKQMPAGGWLHDVSSRENWRTTTIVHRFRDRVSPGSSDKNHPRI